MLARLLKNCADAVQLGGLPSLVEEASKLPGISTPIAAAKPTLPAGIFDDDAPVGALLEKAASHDNVDNGARQPAAAAASPKRAVSETATARKKREREEAAVKESKKAKK